jgi:hypothetical protein
MAQYGGDVRPLSEWGQMRTVCHGCRGVSYEMVGDDDGATVMRPVVVPGDGSVTRMVAAASESGELAVVVPCSICGESDTPGWVPGFVPPA